MEQFGAVLDLDWIACVESIWARRFWCLTCAKIWRNQSWSLEDKEIHNLIQPYPDLSHLISSCKMSPYPILNTSHLTLGVIIHSNTLILFLLGFCWTLPYIYVFLPQQLGERLCRNLSFNHWRFQSSFYPCLVLMFILDCFSVMMNMRN